MKAVSFKTSMTEGASFQVQVDRLPYLYDRLHYHPELQLTLIVKGYGTLFIGDSIVPFQEEDVIVIGSNVPHMWKNDPVFYKDLALGMEAISIHFNQTALGADFWRLPELDTVRAFFRRAKRGLAIGGNSSIQLAGMIKQMVETEGLARLILLLEVLDVMAKSEAEQKTLASIGFEVDEETGDQKLNRVFQYVVDHFHRPLTLPEVAGVANLSVSAFCRYFKLRTRKTFVRFLNEIRIAAACKYLLEEENNITEIAYQVGFNNLSNFNRQFKLVMGSTPSAYIQSVKH